MGFLATIVWLISLYLSSAIGHEIEINAQTRLPVGASKPVEHAFASFSFPIYFFADYAGKKNKDDPQYTFCLHSKKGNKVNPISFHRTSSSFCSRRPENGRILGLEGLLRENISTEKLKKRLLIVTSDHTIYNASQTQAIILSSVSDNGIPLEVTVGPVFFEGFENFYETP